MVDHIRLLCNSLVPRSREMEDETNVLINIMLSSSALTAKPLFDIMRAMVMETMNRSVKNFDELSRNNVAALLRHLASSIENIYKARNNTLHATWYIGMEPPPDHPLFRELYGKKIPSY